MKSKYGHRQHYRAHLTDTRTWKRICSIHELCSSHVTGQSSSYIWSLETHGNFTIRSAYSMLSSPGITMFTHRFIWHRLQQPIVQVMLWKLYHRALPIEDNLKKFLIYLPTCCPFCRSASATQQHIFYQCSLIKSIWIYYAVLLDGPNLLNSALNQYLMLWWTSTTEKSFRGILRIIFPGIMIWNVWKAYSATVFGDERFNSFQLGDRIRHHMYTWSCTQNGKKYTSNDPELLAAGINPGLSCIVRIL